MSLKDVLLQDHLRVEQEEEKPVAKKLTDRKLPAFEVSRSYEEYAHGPEEEPENAEETFDAAYKESQEAQAKTERTDAEKLDAVLTCIGAQNSLREILYKILDHCVEPCEFDEVEKFVAESDEMVYSHIIQTPFTLIQMLKRADGLVETCYDADGELITDERMAELSDDELMDLVERVTLTTTPAGNKAIELVSPQKRFDFLINQRPHRADTFYALLEFCREPRKFPEIQEWFKTTPGLAVDKVQVHHTLAPDFYVDKLDQAGALVWRGAWVTTPEGEQFLAQRPASEE